MTLKIALVLIFLSLFLIMFRTEWIYVRLDCLRMLNFAIFFVWAGDLIFIKNVNELCSGINTQFSVILKIVQNMQATILCIYACDCTVYLCLWPYCVSMHVSALCIYACNRTVYLCMWLYCISMQSSFLRTDDYKIKILIYFGKWWKCYITCSFISINI